MLFAIVMMLKGLVSEDVALNRCMNALALARIFLQLCFYTTKHQSTGILSQKTFSSQLPRKMPLSKLLTLV
jgi:hypothetical protein